MKYIHWSKPNECVNFKVWVYWKCHIGDGNFFHRIFGLEWEDK